MAIWQFYLAVFPKEGILKVKGEIPNKLSFNDETGFFEKEPEKFWKATNIKPSHIINYIDQILPRANWGNKDEFNNSWKLESEFVDNDAWIGLNKERVIEEFYLRFDLREKNLSFLTKIIELGKTENLLFVNRKGLLIEPDLKRILEYVKDSNSFKFLDNPDSFFEDLNLGKIEIE